MYIFIGSDRGEVNVLVPGAGLGRLSYEVAKRGFSCQGNEFSLFMLFASNFVLNRYVLSFFFRFMRTVVFYRLMHLMS